MARYTSGNSGKGSEDNVIYANFGARKRVTSPEEVGRVSRVHSMSPAATRIVSFVNKDADSGRITRGRQYATGGHVVGLDVRNGAVHGRWPARRTSPSPSSFRCRIALMMTSRR